MSKNTPKLRFPEFNGEWYEQKLGNIGGTVRSGRTWQKQENGKYILYGSNGIIGRTNENNYIGPNILVARVGANAGTVNYVDGTYGVSDNTLIINSHKSLILRFLYFILIRKDLNKLTYGSGQPLITGSQLSNLIIFSPKTEDEQTKIANFLSTLDSRITLQSQKVEKLEELKKGYMQKIFSQELRFKREDGSEYGEWEEKKLGDIFMPFDERVGNRNIEPIAVGVYGLRKRSDIYSKELSKDLSKNKVLYKNQFCFGIGSHQMVFGALREDSMYCVSPAYKVYNIPNNDSFYIEEYLNTFNKKLSAEHLIVSARQGKSINFQTLFEENIEIPTLEEQTKIADFFYSFDKQIDMKRKELEKLQELKKGLLQQMFV